MHFNWSIISKKIYGILKGSCESLVMYDAKGNETIDPDEATRFFAAFKSANPELEDFTILVAVHDEGARSYIDIKTPELDDDADFNKVNSIRTGIRKSIGEREGIKINWQVFDHAIDPREEAVHNIKETTILGKDMSSSAKSADIDQCDKEYIAQRKEKQKKKDLLKSKETSQISELSKKTLKRYADAAVDDLETSAYFNGEKTALAQDYYADEYSERAEKRRKGLKMAIDKLEEKFDNLAESKDISRVYGSTKSSFQNIGNAKLIVRHSASVNEDKHGARSRNIKALFVENKDGERFKYPHLHVSGARAFARHISNGGTNHDNISQKIFSISENYLHLRRSGAKLRLIEGIDQTWLPSIRESMNRINKKLKSMHGPKGYATSLTSLLEENSIEDAVMINELYSELMEKCGYDNESPYAADFKIAAKYIAERRLDPKPINFSWNSKLNLESKLNEFTKVSERLTWQLNELAAACTDQAAMSKLASIAEMISNGVMPNADDMGIIKQAFESHESYIHEDAMIQEEEELNEFLDDFTIESTFADEGVKVLPNGRKVRTNHVYPPIPTRNFDWSATDDDAGYEPGNPLGTGATEDEAIQDLLDQLEDESEITETSRKIKQYTDPSGRSANVYRDPDFNEFIVKFYVDGIHQENADYHTNDKQDAFGTAELFISHQHTIKPHVTEAGPEDFDDDTLDDDFEDDDDMPSLMRNYHGMVKDEFDNLDETKYESGLTEEMPRIIHGVVGLQSKPFKKKFKNQSHQDAWIEHNGGYDNMEIYTIERIDGLSEDEMSNDGFGPLYHAQRLYQQEVNNPHMRISDLPKHKQDEYVERVLNGERGNKRIIWNPDSRDYSFAEDMDAGKDADAAIDAFGVTEASNDQDIQMDVHNDQDTAVADSETNGNQFSESDESLDLIRIKKLSGL